ncbi:MAG: 2-amino-4-hydroxy-6-hydroxymethyldihydropteridine diphosphokinase [Bacteroidia bacterium]
MNKGIYLLLGSNMGNASKHLSDAINHIKQLDLQVVAESSVYKTAAWGKTDQHPFLNQCLAVESNMSPETLLSSLLQIEKEMGRVRIEKWAERIIDIDILFYHDLIMETNSLQIPHPHLHERRFTLVPLCEIAPQMLHPKLGISALEMLSLCADSLDVEKL